MQTIFKYVIGPGRTMLVMPRGACPLAVQEQRGDHCLWARVDTTQPDERRAFDVYGTGHQLRDSPGMYVATYQTDGGALVWHVFDATRAT